MTKPPNFKERGFSINELMIVATVIAILTVVAIPNFQKIKLQLSLSQVAYKFEQDLRRVQSMSLSSAVYKDVNGQEVAVKGYGIYVDSFNNPKRYILYADSSTGNRQYDVSDYVIDTVDFSLIQPGIIIKEIDNITGPTASINFSPPNPMTTITPAPSQNSVLVVFAFASDLTVTKTVSVNTAGLIEVK